MNAGKIMLFVLFAALVCASLSPAQVDQTFIREYRIGARDLLEITVVELPS